MAMNVALSSSLRAVPPEETLARAKRRAAALGITRVTNVTRLDRVGIPVYMSIRPNAAPGSLCVNAGKGLHPIEAEVGAYMEAIEFAMAEPGGSHVQVRRATARNVLDGRRRPTAVLDLCPVLGCSVGLDTVMDCVEADELSTGARALVPAELVFLPYHRPRHRRIFGSSSNGLASGNSLREATVHGLCEVIERDVQAFASVHDASVLVDLDGDVGVGRELVETIRRAGLDLFVRATPNAFGLPYFSAMIHDPDTCAPHLLNGGYGCHPHRSIAFVRAVCEAAQSRLSYIHGGRDDLTLRHDRFKSASRARKEAYVRRVVGAFSRGPSIPFAGVDDLERETATIERSETVLLSRLRALGLSVAYRVAFCRPRDPLQVVRVIVPRMEMFDESLRRVGPRLRDHARAS